MVERLGSNPSPLMCFGGVMMMLGFPVLGVIALCACILFQAAYIGRLEDDQ